MLLARFTHSTVTTHLTDRRWSARQMQCATTRAIKQSGEPAVVQFSREDHQSVTEGLQTVATAFLSDAVTEYLSEGAGTESRIHSVQSYGEHQLAESSSADLLFQVDEFSAAAFCYRIPEQLVVPETEAEASEDSSEEDRPQLLDRCFAKGRWEFLQEHGSFILVSLIGVHPDKQRRGLGSRLMTAICNIADNEQKWCYLEASSEASAAMYAKHGFVPLSKTRAGPEAPIIQLMGRSPC